MRVICASTLLPNANAAFTNAGEHLLCPLLLKSRSNDFVMPLALHFLEDRGDFFIRLFFIIRAIMDMDNKSDMQQEQLRNLIFLWRNTHGSSDKLIKLYDKIVTCINTSDSINDISMQITTLICNRVV
jgi:hypothetical protein